MMQGFERVAFWRPSSTSKPTNNTPQAESPCKRLSSLFLQIFSFKKSWSFQRWNERFLSARVWKWPDKSSGRPRGTANSWSGSVFFSWRESLNSHVAKFVFLCGLPRFLGYKLPTGHNISNACSILDRSQLPIWRNCHIFSVCRCNLKSCDVWLFRKKRQPPTCQSRTPNNSLRHYELSLRNIFIFFGLCPLQWNNMK